MLLPLSTSSRQQYVLFPIGIEIVHINHSLFYDSAMINIIVGASSGNIATMHVSILIKVTKCSVICYNMLFHYRFPFEKKVI